MIGRIAIGVGLMTAGFTSEVLPGPDQGNREQLWLVPCGCTISTGPPNSMLAVTAGLTARYRTTSDRSR